MKRMIIALVFAASVAVAQTVPIVVPGTGEPTVNVLFNSTGVNALQLDITNTPATGVWPNSLSSVPQSTTLSGAMTANATTASLASTAGLAVCNGLLIGSEVMLVTSVSPSLVLQRATIGTAAQAYASGTPVTVLRVGAYACRFKAMWADSITGIVTQKLGNAAASQSAQSLAAQQAAILTLAIAAVQ
jgi:hypothetical protein